jgi:DNA-binding transcriptional LysR family regulator
LRGSKKSIPGYLFVRRRGAPLTLTPVGEALLPLAQAMLHTADQSFLRTNGGVAESAGRLSVGFYPGIANGPLRDGLIAFRAECPDVELNLSKRCRANCMPCFVTGLWI